jgi:streptogramin lyase
MCPGPDGSVWYVEKDSLVAQQYIGHVAPSGGPARFASQNGSRSHR